MIKTKLKNILSDSLLGRLGELPKFALSTPPKGFPGDYSVNLPMIYAKKNDISGHRAVETVFAALREIKEIENVIPAGGFINFTVTRDFLIKCLEDVIARGDDIYRLEEVAGRRALIEFVSSNPTGPLHVGHARCAAIGDSLARLYELLGYSVEREYYVNDMGNQVETLGKSVAARISELENKPSEFPENGYRGAYIYDIAREIIASGRADAKKYALESIMKSTELDLAAFDVKMDRYFSESSLAGEVGHIMEDFKSRGLAYEKDNALWFGSSVDADDKDRVLKKRTGEYTYFATDIAYHKNKFARGYDEIINVWGADHHGYVARVKAAVRALGFDAEKLKVVLYQLVSLRRGAQKIAMSTRAGEFVTLKEVVDEVGTSAARFFLLMRAPGTTVEFDLELAKKQTAENPVFYVQYAHARICSIFAEAVRRGVAMPDVREADLSLLDAPAERELIKTVCSLGDTLALCRRELTAHYVTLFLAQTARELHNFYEHCRVISEDGRLTAARLTLLAAARKTLKTALSLLGAEAPEKM